MLLVAVVKNTTSVIATIETRQRDGGISIMVVCCVCAVQLVDISL
jgi:hypothetical protein